MIAVLASPALQLPTRKQTSSRSRFGRCHTSIASTRLPMTQVDVWVGVRVDENKTN